MSDAAMGLDGETNLVAEAMLALSSAGCMIWRQNTGRLMSHGRLVSFGLVGSGDIIGMMPDGRFLSAEAKVGNRKPSPAQYAFASAVAKHNGLAVWFRSVPELMQAIGL